MSARVALMTLAGVAAISAIAWAQQPPAWAQAHPGLWEISGAPGATSPIRQCIGDLAALAEFEHRGKNCAPHRVSSSGSSTVVEYRCGSAGFGRTQVDVITPRSLRIDTQGISNKLPFAYVLQARRIGDCPEQAPAPRH